MTSLGVLLGLVWWSACTEYAFVGDKDPGEGAGDPAEAGGSAGGDGETPGAVDPALALDLGHICGVTETTLAIENHGDAELVVFDAVGEGDGWTLLTLPELPVQVEPGDALVVGLSTGGGTGTLVLETSDPDHPTLSVPLYAVENTPPTLTLPVPTADGVLPPGLTTTFAATVEEPSYVKVKVEPPSCADALAKQFVGSAMSFGMWSTPVSAANTNGSPGQLMTMFAAWRGWCIRLHPPWHRPPMPGGRVHAGLRCGPPPARRRRGCVPLLH